MSKRTPFTELLKQSPDDLRREIRAQSLTVRKLQMGIALRKEKDTAQYKRERKAIARMQTALTQKAKEPLKQAKKSATVPPSKS